MTDDRTVPYEHSRRRGVELAWELYCRDGVVCPEYADEIAARKDLLREWGMTGRELR